MGMKYLAVDSDVALAESEAVVWAERGIEMDRVDTMTEGIQKLLSNQYLYIGINSDAVDFMPLLKTMRSVTNAPILIVTGNFTTETEVAALKNGADLYARWHKTTEGNIASVLAHIDKASERGRTPKPTPTIIVCGSIIIVADHKMVFCKDAEIMLTPKEYGVFHCLLSNQGITMTFEHISQMVWGEEDVSNDAIQQIIIRLRKKLDDSGFKGWEITSVRSIGYRFAATSDN